MSVPDRLVEIDGIMRRPDGIWLPVSIGLPYNLAELLRKPVKTAMLRGTKPYGVTVTETWELPDGRTFEVAQDERFARSERSMTIGSVRGQDGQEVLVFQKIPPHYDNPITQLTYSSR